MDDYRTHALDAGPSSAGVALLAGDALEAEVAQVYANHAVGLLRYAAMTVRNREGAQDAVQEVFLRYFVTRSQGQRILNHKAWLYRVLRNYLLDSLKSSSSKNEIIMEEMRHVPDHRQDPEVSYRHQELARRVLGLLAPRELECLRLRNEGFGYEEIAGILSVRTGTVAALLSRGQKKIRQAMEQKPAEMEPRWVENLC